jgi:hypothetical protein
MPQRKRHTVLIGADRGELIEDAYVRPSIAHVTELAIHDNDFAIESRAIRHNLNQRRDKNRPFRGRFLTRGTETTADRHGNPIH